MARALRRHQAIFLEEPADSDFDRMLAGTRAVEDYLAERNATRALISFYSISMSASFDDTLEAVKRFARADAARFRLRDSLIYSKLIAKTELTEEVTSWPHLRDELNCIDMTKRLSLDDCRSLYPRIRHADIQQAHEMAKGIFSFGTVCCQTL